MAAANDLADAILTLAGQARQVVVDRQQVTRRGLNELIDADQYLSAKESAKRPGSILSFVRLIPQSGGG